jgi:hypothetical protein
LRIEVGSDEDPAKGKAPYSYTLYAKCFNEWSKAGSLRFQNEPMTLPAGPNGISIESILAVAIDRLQVFQRGPYSCRENAIAITHMEEAMHWLHHRTKDRLERDVLGKMEK